MHGSHIACHLLIAVTNSSFLYLKMHVYKPQKSNYFIPCTCTLILHIIQTHYLDQSVIIPN